MELLRMLCIRKFENYDRSEKHKWKAWVKIISVYDGDTITVLIRLNSKFVKWRARLMGFDAPEMRTPNVEEKQKAEEAKEFLKTLLSKGIFRLQIHGLDKYGRLLIDPLYKGKKICDIMIQNNHGYAYYGGKKEKHYQ